MSQSLVLVILAAIMLLLVPIIPKMISLRIRILHWLKLHRLADWHQRYSKGISVFVRVVLVVLAGYLLYIGVPGL
jgi:hypothetical protein